MRQYALYFNGLCINQSVHKYPWIITKLLDSAPKKEDRKGDAAREWFRDES